MTNPIHLQIRNYVANCELIYFNLLRIKSVMAMKQLVNLKVDVKIVSNSTYILDVLWGQPIKLIQVASNSELSENQ